MVTHVPGPRARRAVAGTRFAALEWVAETTSTQADVLELARQGASEGQVVVADHQSGGHGRAGRSWEAPAATSILMSLLLRPPAPVAGIVTALVGLSAADAIEAVAGFRPDLKWPNDLVVTDDTGSTRKLAGILAEADWPPGADMASGWRDPKASERVAVIAGIGINVNWPEAIPDELAEIATSCRHVTGREHDRVEIVVHLLQSLDAAYTSLLEHGPAPTMARWRESLSTLGRPVRVDLGADDVHGRAVDVTDEGHLVVETTEGERRTFAVGDVHHLRTT